MWDLLYMQLASYLDVDDAPFTYRTCMLTLKAPIMTAADDKFWDIFPNFRQK